MLEIVLIVVAAVAVFWFIAVPVFERFAPAPIVRGFRRLTMPLFRPTAGLVPGFGVLETVGRRTGRRFQTPVGGRLSGDTFWFVAGLGHRAHYVRNIEANPRVRVKIYGRWRSGTAQICPDDDARKRMVRVNPINGLFVWIAGGNHLSIRVDLDAKPER